MRCFVLLAKKSTFKLDISRTKCRISKILSLIDSTNQITYIDYHKTSFRLKLIFDQLELNHLNLTISWTEGYKVVNLLPLNFMHKITYNYILKEHSPMIQNFQLFLNMHLTKNPFRKIPNVIRSAVVAMKDR